MSPVVNDVPIKIILVLLLMARLDGYILDAYGIFLLGFLKDGEIIFMEVPEGFEKHFKEDEVNELQKTIYSLK